MSRSARKISDLTRQLNLLPYFQRHPDRTVMEAARDFGLPPEEIMADLNRLWMCGLPGLLPGDLVELEHTYTSVKIHNAQGMDKALRLTPTEAGVLLLTLESLEHLPGLTNQQSVISAAEKLRGVMGEYTSAVFDTAAQGDASGNGVLAIIREALNRGKQVSFTYHSHSSDSTSIRQVSPAHVFTNEGEAYVRAWDDAVHGHRTFRVDRIRDMSLTDAPADPHLKQLNFSADKPFESSPASEQVQFLLREDATWLADYMSMDLAGESDYITDGQGITWVPASRPLYSRDWFIRFSISQADRIIVTGPETLVESIRSKVDAGLSAYKDQLS